MLQKNIILTGFMGTGKTTLGRLLAERIGYKFVDTDAQIEQQMGQSIAEIFQEQGEEAFRKLEAKLARQLAQQEGLVIATGGGMMLNSQNIVELSRAGQIICLTATPEEILARVSKQQQIRPLLEEVNPQKKIEKLLQQRHDIYLQFIQVSTSEKTINDLIHELLKLTQLS